MLSSKEISTTSPKTRFRKGVTLFQQKDFKESQEWLIPNDTLFNATAERSSHLNAYNAYYIGLNYNSLGNYSLALTYLQKAKEIATTTLAKNLLPNILFEIGRSFQKNNDVTTASDFFKLAISRFQTLPSTPPQNAFLADAFIQLGLCYIELKENALATFNLTKGLAILKPIMQTKADYMHLYAHGSYALGSFYLLSGDATKAEAMISKSVSLFKQLNSKSNLIEATLLQSICYLKLNLPNLASVSIEALHGIESNGLKNFILGLCYGLLKNYTEASTCLMHSLKEFQKNPSETKLLGMYHIFQFLEKELKEACKEDDDKVFLIKIKAVLDFIKAPHIPIRKESAIEGKEEKKEPQKEETKARFPS